MVTCIILGDGAQRIIMDVFRLLATETASALGFCYPTAIDARIAEWVKARLLGRRVQEHG